MAAFLTVEGLVRLLQRVKTIFATKTEVSDAVEDLKSSAGEAGQTLVHRTGDETIAGVKTFSSAIQTGVVTSRVGSGAVHKIVNTGITKGSDTISAWTYIPFVDSSEAESNQQGRLGYVGYNYNKKAVTGCLVAYNGTTAANTSSARLAVGFDSSGSVFTEAPTPAAADDSTKIATTAFVKAQGYITASGSITGSSASCTGNAATATKLGTARALWGNNFDGSAAVSGAISGVPAIELKPTASTSNNGGYLDFHYNQSTSDYTSRIIESASGTLSINGVTVTTGKVVTATTFSGALTGDVTGSCSGSSGSCTGNAATATKATQDGSGNTITSTYVNLTGSQTISGAKYYTADYYRKDTGAVKGTAPSANRWQNGVRFVDNNNVAFGGIERGFLSDGTNRVNMIVYKGTTTDTSTNSQIGVGFDGSGNWFTYAPTPATADNTTKIATTAFVKAQGYLTSQTQLSLTNSGSGNAVTGISVSNHAITVTKGSTFLTSHQSLSNYVTLNSEQNITSTKNLTGFRIYNTGITYNANPSENSYVSMGLCDKNKASLGSATLYLNSDGAKGLMFRLTKYHENSVNSILTIGVSAANAYSVTCYGAIQPGSNNTLSCGTSSRKWTAVYATNATIQTSDEREKQSIAAVPDNVLDAWEEVEWCQFQMKDSVQKKGIDAARIHTGAIAQRIKAVFERHGIDPFRYGLLCYDEWEYEPDILDENGNVCNAGCPAGNQYSLRYEEALALEAACQRRRADRLEARIAALEAKMK